VIDGRHHNFDGEPAFSPDGRRIVFVSDRKGYPNIFVMNADGSQQRRLTRGSGFEASPSFSPGGHRIAFASSPTLFSRIFIMDSNGEHMRKLTRKGYSYDPAFSPVAPKIVYAKDGARAAGDLRLMRANGRHSHPLTHDPQDETMPSFSPDGQRLAYLRGSNIYVMSIRGTHQRRLTHTPGIESRPSWGRVPSR
jgi:Tol biopolymer transport system component